MFITTIGVVSLGSVKVLDKFGVFDYKPEKNPSPIVEFRESKERYRDYAFKFLNVLDKTFLNGKRGYKEKTGWLTYEASNWALSRVVEAQQDLLLLSKEGQTNSIAEKHKQTIAHLETYYDKEKAQGSMAHSSSFYVNILGLEVGSKSKREHPGKFIDDNIWNGLNALRDGDIETAQSVYNFVIKSWDDKKGGIYWKQQNPDETNDYRNTVTAAGAMQLVLRLYKETGTQDEKVSYLEWTEKLFKWLNSNLKDSDGLYHDGIGDKTKWSYNQGLMIGNYTLLYEVFRESNPSLARDFLTSAMTLADKSMNYYNNILDNSKTSKLYLDYINNPELNAVYYRNLLYLCSHAGNDILVRKVKQTIQSYTNEVGTLYYEDDSKIYRFKKHNKDDNYEETNNKFLVKEFGMLQIFAMLGMDEDDYEKLF